MKIFLDPKYSYINIDLEFSASQILHQFMKLFRFNEIKLFLGLPDFDHFYRK